MDAPEAIGTAGPPARVMNALLVAFAIALPLLPAALPVLLVALVATQAWAFVAGPRVRRRFSWSSPLPWMLLFYLAHVLGLLWTTNVDFAGLDLGIKAPLLVFPVLFLLGGPVADVRGALRAFVLANTVAVLVCLVRAIVRAVVYVSQVGPGEVLSGYTLSVPFFASDLAFFMHPTYMAMYLTLALVLLTRPAVCGAWPAGRRWALGAVLVAGVVLCASKAGWLVLLVLGMLFLMEHRKDRRMRRTILAGLLVAIAAGIVLFATNAYVHERVMQVVDTLHEEAPTPDAANSTDDRRLVWHAAWPVAKAHAWTGVGTGDVKDELLRSYAAHGYVEPLRKQLNAHDQYLNTVVALGIGGVALLLAMVLVPLWTAIRRKEGLLLAFLLLNALNWTVESMLEVQAGVMFLGFFTWLWAAPFGERR